MLKFITGNKNKFKETSRILFPFNIQQANINLEEIQELDPKKIIIHKLKQGYRQVRQECFVEDSSLYLGCLNNRLPGPFLKWFEDVLSLKELVNLTKRMSDNSAEVHTVVGYTKNGNDFKIFEARLKGQIVAPKGSKDFGYGPIFQPEGSNKTYGQMQRYEKYQISSRGKAIRKLKNYLLK